jgi:hypothetical protein
VEIAKLVLEYLKAFMSWPSIVLILGLVFIHKYQAALTGFIGRLVRGQLYGVMLEASQPIDQQKKAEQIEPVATLPQAQPGSSVEDYVRNNPTEVITEFQKVFNGYWFERCYHLLFGSQITLLEHLQTKGQDGDLYINITHYYQIFLSQAAAPTIQLADYVRFLETTKFLELQTSPDTRLRITAYGVDFLSYMKTEYPGGYYKAL